VRIAGIAALTAVLLVSACGSGSDSSYANSSPDDIAEDVADAMKDVVALRMVGTITAGAQNVDVDLAIAESGNCEGTMSYEGQGDLDHPTTPGQVWPESTPIRAPLASRGPHARPVQFRRDPHRS
jgi:hypothetical protein